MRSLHLWSHRRGIALLLVLLLLSVVITLTGAFLALNRNNFDTLSASERERAARRGVNTAVSLCTYKLEHNTSWAQDPFGTNRTLFPESTGVELEEVGGSSRVRGRVPDASGSGEESTFEVAITNLLNSKVAGERVPADCALLSVTARCRGIVCRADVMLKGQPIYDASLTSNGAISLAYDNKEVNVRSNDPERNWLRSNGDVLLPAFAPGTPDYDSSRSVKVSSAGAPSVLDGGPGVVWANGDIKSGNTLLKGDALASAVTASKGSYAARSRLNHDVYKLTENDLNLGNDNHDDDVVLDAGSYYIVTGDMKWTDGDGDHTEPVRAVQHISQNGGDAANKIYLDASTSDKLDKLEGAKTTKSLSFPDWKGDRIKSGVDGVVNLTGSTVAKGTDDKSGALLSDTSGSGLKYDFTTNTFNSDVVHSTIQVAGDLNIWSNDLDTPAHINLTAESTGSAAWSGVIKASGSIRAQANIVGGGALIAGKDINLLAIGGNTDFDAKGNGVVLYGESVNIGAAPTVKNRGMVDESSTSEVSFKGLIYAQKDVVFYGGFQVDKDADSFTFSKDARLNHLEFRGAVVSNQGSITIAKCDKVDLTYDPDYLRELTLGLHAGLTYRRLDTTSFCYR